MTEATRPGLLPVVVVVPDMSEDDEEDDEDKDQENDEDNDKDDDEDNDKDDDDEEKDDDKDDEDNDKDDDKDDDDEEKEETADRDSRPTRARVAGGRKSRSWYSAATMRIARVISTDDSIVRFRIMCRHISPKVSARGKGTANKPSSAF